MDIEVATHSGSLNRIVPAKKRHPKPDENGNETGPCCAHAYADGWNDCCDRVTAMRHRADNRGMTKVVISTCYGGFGLSSEAAKSICARKGIAYSDGYGGTPEDCFLDIDRDDHDLVAVVEEMGRSASGRFADLKIVEVPEDVLWEIQDYDGAEWVAEKHRTWR